MPLPQIIRKFFGINANKEEDKTISKEREASEIARLILHSRIANTGKRFHEEIKKD